MSANLDRRFSPAEVSAWRRLPGSPARTFAVASALGRAVRADGTFGPLRGGRDVVGVVVGPAQRRRVREALDLSERRWREFLQLVEELGIGHRCRRGVLVPPFLGGGTTAVVALAAGCRFIGAEVDPEAYRGAMGRLSQELPS